MEELRTKSDESRKDAKRVIAKQEVKILDIANGTALVEWIKNSSIFRAYVPARVLEDGQVDPDELAKGVPFGDDLKAEFKAINPAELEQELNKHGIWTIKDIELNINLVLGVVMRLNESHVVDYLRKIKR